jgi:hypothetical protein
MVLGVLSLIMCAPLGVAAWVMGNTDLKAMDSGTMDSSGRSITNAGRVLGIIGTLLLVVGGLTGLALILMLASL